MIDPEFEEASQNVVPMTRAFAPSTARVIQQAREFKQPGLRQGLCPTCLNSGYVHEYRTIHGQQVLGVVYDGPGKQLQRCACAIGQKLDEEIRRDVLERRG